MGCCMRLPCCIDDSYDYKCEKCNKKLPREQEELFLFADTDEDKIFCSTFCRDKFVNSASSLLHILPPQSPLPTPNST